MAVSRFIQIIPASNDSGLPDTVLRAIQFRRHQDAWNRQARSVMFYQPPVGLRFATWLRRKMLLIPK